MHFWAAGLSSLSSSATAWVFWAEMTVGTPNSEGETGITFGILSLSSPFLLGSKKKEKVSWYESEFYLCSQDSELIFVSGAWFKRKYLEARSLQCTSVLKDVLSSFYVCIFYCCLRRNSCQESILFKKMQYLPLVTLTPVMSSALTPKLILPEHQKST